MPTRDTLKVPVMKITPADYCKLREAVCGVLDAGKLAPGTYRSANLTPKRFRWDCLWASGLKIGDGIGIQGDINVYAYANDDHIDTALRRIMRERGEDWGATP